MADQSERLMELVRAAQVAKFRPLILFAATIYRDKTTRQMLKRLVKAAVEANTEVDVPS